MQLIDVKTLECPACNAPYAPNQERCGFCGSALPRHEQPPLQPGVDPQLANREIADYYALLGLNPLHLLPEEPPPPSRMRRSASELAATLTQRRPPTPSEVREAALATEQRLLLMPGLTPEQRQEQSEQIEIAGWILADERARLDYDGALIALRKGSFNEGHFNLLADLRRRAAQELGLQGEMAGGGPELLRQGLGYLGLGMYREASEALRQAVELLPDSAEARYRYAQALLASEDALALGPHKLRQAAQSFEAAGALEPSLRDARALAALCRGLLARQEGDATKAAAELRQAIGEQPRLSAAWRGLAALAFQAGDDGAVLSHCRQALLADPKDEGAYALLVAACWRSGQRAHARDAAARIAALRGPEWNAERVLKDIIG